MSNIARREYKQFYTKQGIVQDEHYKHPRVFYYKDLVLPLYSILHWVDYDQIYDFGPTDNEPLIKNVDSKTVVAAITEYPPDYMGQVFLSKVNIKDMLSTYDRENPHIARMLKPVENYNDKNILPLFTYGLLDNRYRYIQKVDTNLRMWHNYHYTIFNNVYKVAKQSDRQQFLELPVPKRFPTLTHLKEASARLSSKNVNKLPHPDNWLFVNFWNLIAQNGNAFIFKDFINLSDFDKVNIIWKIEDKCVIMNMGRFIGLAHGKDAKLTPQKLQRLFYKFMVTLSTLKELDTGSDAIDNSKELNTDSDNEPKEVNIKRDEFVEDEEPQTNDLEEENEEYIDPEERLRQRELKEFENKTKQYNTRNVNIAPEKIVLDDEVEEDENSLEVDEDELIDIAGSVATDDTTVQAYKKYVPDLTTADEIIKADAERLVKAGIMSVGEYNRYSKLIDKSHTLPAPLNSDKTIKEEIVIDPDSLKIDEVNEIPIKSNDIIDESMVSSSMNKYHEKYITDVFQKDVLRMVMNTQKGGVIIKDYNVELVETINDKYHIHKIQIETLKGHVSTLSFKVPYMEEDGTFKVSGTKRFIRKQRGSIPIHKVEPHSVSLTSYYSKMFVNRTMRKQFNYEDYLHNYVIRTSMESDSRLSEIKFSNVFDNTIKAPKVYTTLARKFYSVKVDDDTFYFDINKSSEIFTDSLSDKDLIPLAKDKDNRTSIYIHRKTGLLHDKSGNSMDMTLEKMLGIDNTKLPLEYAEVDIFGRAIPIVLILGYHIGFGNLLETLKIKYRRETRGSRLYLTDDEFAIKFSDETLVFNKNSDKKSLLIICGLLRCKNTLSITSVYELDGKSIYNDLFEEIKAPIKLLKESKDMFNLWVDPITEQLLLDMNEPTDLFNIFLRAVELITTDEHPDSIDPAYMRDKGTERMAGIVYEEIVKAIREYNTRPIFNNNKLTMNPEAVWYGIITDQSVSLCEDSNPIHAIKEKEVIVYSGRGGRSGQTMTAATRKYHKNNLGVVSESNVDSGDAGTIFYNSSDPSYNTVYGTTRRVNPKTIKPAQMVSTSVMLAPGAINSDPKRINFISVQNSQTTFVDGATPMPMRTGMEKVLAHKTSKMFAQTAKDEGTVVEKTDSFIKIEYKDGSSGVYKIGRQLGKWSGYNIPHDLVTNLKKGDKVNKGDCVYYNKSFFSTDPTDNNNVIFKNHVLGRVALVENIDVYEDSAAMSAKFSEELHTRITHIRNIRLTSENTVKNLVKVGDTVGSDSILCTIHSAQLGGGNFSDDVLSSLESISSLNPKAGYAGVIDKVSVIYTADLEELDEELADIVRESDTRIYRESKKLGQNIKNGRVDIGFNIDGVKMTLGEVVIQVYITETRDMTIADKIVVSNQLKATVGRYWNEPLTTEDGVEFDLMFSAKSIDNRIVLDAELMGSTNSLLVACTDEVIKAFDK